MNQMDEETTPGDNLVNSSTTEMKERIQKTLFEDIATVALS
jgi:hypothetical protein